MRTILGLGSGATGLWMLWTPAALFLLFFYTEVLGIPPATAGAIFFVALVWDAVLDPIVGVIADRSRWSYRTWMVASIVPTCLFAVLIFAGLAFEGGWLVAFTLAIHLIFRTLFTLVFVPFSAIMSNLAETDAQRGIYAGAVSHGYSVGAVLVAIGFLWIVGRFETGPGWLGYAAAAAAYSIAAAILIFIATLLLKIPKHQSAKHAMALPHLAQDRPLWCVVIAILVYAISFSTMLKSVPYYFKYVLEQEDITSIALTVTMGTGIVAVPLWAWFIVRTSRLKAWAVGLALYVTGALITAGNWPADTTFRIWIGFFLMAAGINGFIVAYLGLLVEAAKSLNARLATKTDAVVQGLGSFAVKASSGGGAWIVGRLLSASGFVANQEAGPIVKQAITSAMLMWPAVGFAAAGLIVFASGYGRKEATA